MKTEFWINLPVKNIAASRAFFRAIGIPENQAHSDNPAMIALQVGHTMVMLFPDDQFEHFISGKKTDTVAGNETLLSFSAETRAEVDAMAEKVKDAGGSVYGKPSEVQGWMYGMGFRDPDGHAWNMLYMDPAEKQK